MELNQILGIKEEMLVCIQSPHLQKTPEIATLDWSTQDLEMSVRKMVVKEDPIKYVRSFIYSQALVIEKSLFF